MNDMERRKFEDSFQEAFRNAEMNPSENVWTNIELDLERANGDSMKKRIVFFKMLAAASVIFALCAGGLTYYFLSDDRNGSMIAEQKASTENQAVGKDPSSLPQQTEIELENRREESSNAGDTRTDGSTEREDPVSKSRTENSSTVIASDDNNNTNSASENDASRTPRQVPPLHNSAHGTNSNPTIANNDLENRAAKDGVATERTTLSELAASNDNPQRANQIGETEESSTLTSGEDASSRSNLLYAKTSERKLPKFYEPQQPELEFPTSTADPGMVLLARLADEERRYSEDQKSKKSDSEGLWTSVGFAAGAFAANSPNVTPAPSNSFANLMANTVQTAAKQSKASGSSYSVGVSLGTKISERWVLQGGVNYLTQSSDYTANSVVVIDNNYNSLKAESLNAFTGQIADASAQPKVAQTFPYNVNNNVRFVSVPLQAGYLLIDRKFGLQLNAGVSTDLFLQNTITPDGGGVTKTTQGRGDDSPYRSLNFSGLMGTELSYRLGSRYRVSLNPGLRYPLKSVYKDNMGIDATPLTFDVGLRFRYIFH